MVGLLRFCACLLILGACPSWAEPTNQMFHLVDVNSRDYKITGVSIEYPKGKVSDGFWILEENQSKSVSWSVVTSLKIETPVEDGEPPTYLKCSVELTNGKTVNLTCLNGTLLGITRNGDYRKPLDRVIELRPVRLK